jgi:hypothetical protein
MSMAEQMDGDRIAVRYRGGHASVRIGDRELTIDRRDDPLRAYTCPIELLTAALGS